MRLVGNLTTNVAVAKLIAKLKSNQKIHEQTYLKALEGWRREVTKVADKTKDLATNGELRRLPGEWRDVLDVPQNYSEEYANATAMLEASVDDSVELNQEQFNCFWLDQWGWKDSWLETSSNYTDK